MTYLSDYINYFKDLATRHPNLLHQDVDGLSAFSAIYIEEILSNFRNKMRPRGYALHAIRYTSEGRDNAQNYRNIERQAGFIITGFAEGGNTEERIAMESNCERIAYEIIAKICDDSNANHPLFKYSMNRANFTMQPLDIKSNALNYGGYTVFFNFIVPNTVCTANVAWVTD